VRVVQFLLAFGLLTSIACHPGPVLSSGPKPAVGGTIAGIVSTDTKAALAGRRVTAINTQTGTRFDATTGVNGGYTIKVPEGTYRIEVELQPGETVAKQPAETRVNRSDLDPRRDFVITLGKD
jgi:Carboxypeptidase regulatory-like domain